MSNYSIGEIDKFKYLREFAETLKYNFSKYFMFQRFRVGKDADYEEIEHSVIYSKILERGDCDIIDYFDYQEEKKRGCKLNFGEYKEYKKTCPKAEGAYLSATEW